MSTRDAVAVLRAAGVASPEHDARALAAHAETTGADFAELVRRRAAREPLQHLVGSTGFRYIDVAVGPGVFVPRPETEIVAGLAIDAARRAGPGSVVVDLCSGSGAIALAVANEVPSAHVHAVELDPNALDWLRRNAAARVQAGDPPITVHAADVLDVPATLDDGVDVVVANPPYLTDDGLAVCEPEVREHDPHGALVASGHGLDVIRDVAQTAHRLLRSGGVVVVEHGDDQGDSAPQVLRAAGFAEVDDQPDLTGRPRVAIGTKP